MVKARPPVRFKPTQPHVLHEVKEPNDVWSADFKGKFKHANGKWCYPFTLTDNCSRIILASEATYSPNNAFVVSCLERIFIENGMPQLLQTDNGAPFAGNRLWGLSVMSVWLLKCTFEKVDSLRYALTVPFTPIFHTARRTVSGLAGAPDAPDT